MLNYTTKKKNKLNIYKAVRENIHLNKNNGTAIDLPKHFINEDNLIFQLAEINLTDHLQAKNSNKKGKLVEKWWEN